jgi:hypothetical protein
VDGVSLDVMLLDAVPLDAVPLDADALACRADAAFSTASRARTGSPGKATAQLMPMATQLSAIARRCQRLGLRTPTMYGQRPRIAREPG